MSDIEVIGPDGATLLFPAGTARETIRSAMAKRYGAPKAGNPPPPGAVIHHGDGRTTVEGRPDLTIDRSKVAGTEREGIMLEAQRRRAEGGEGGLAQRLMPFGQGLSFNMLDEAASALSAPVNASRSGNTMADEYAVAQEQQQQMLDAERAARPKTAIAGEIAGNVATGVGLMNAGLSAGMRAANAGRGLGMTALGSAVDGAAMGGLAGFGATKGDEERRWEGAKGAGVGVAAGVLAPLVMAGGGRIMSPLVNNISARFDPARHAAAALLERMRSAGLSPDDIADQLRRAASDGQGMFTVADAMGNAGGRALATVARSPNDARQAVVDALMQRQAGQGRRIAGYLAEGFDAADTAAQRTAALTDARRAAGNANYGAARDAAGAVDPTAAIAAIDDVVRPGVTPMIGTGATDNSVYNLMSRARSYLTNGRAVVQDFDRALLAKQEMDAIIEQGGTAAALLRPARNALDDALAAASGPYAQARDAYRQGSKAIEAVETGQNAAMRGRTEDTTRAFAAMTPDEQAAFRAGYADPLIADAQKAATGVNKARPLINDATAIEFPAFAAQGRSQQMQDRLAREQRMFETTTAATGGSRTADNLADMADKSVVDPGVIRALLRGDIGGALVQSGGKVGNWVSGMSPAVLEHMGRGLMSRDPGATAALLARAAEREQMTKSAKQALINVLLAGSVPASVR